MSAGMVEKGRGVRKESWTGDFNEEFPPETQEQQTCSFVSLITRKQNKVMQTKLPSRPNLQPKVLCVFLVF